MHLITRCMRGGVQRPLICNTCPADRLLHDSYVVISAELLTFVRAVKGRPSPSRPLGNLGVRYYLGLILDGRVAGGAETTDTQPRLSLKNVTMYLRTHPFSLPRFSGCYTRPCLSRMRKHAYMRGEMRSGPAWNARASADCPIQGSVKPREAQTNASK